MIDANWINALKLPAKVLAGLFIATIVLLIFDNIGLLELSTFGALAKPATILICVISGALSFTTFVSFFIELFNANRKRTLLQQRRELRKREQCEEIDAQKQRALSRIEHLSKDELRYLADCLRENSQSFTTYVHSPPASTLLSKGLIYTPGGTHHQDYYPFVVRDFVWQYLLGCKDQIIAKDDENKRIEKEKERNSRHHRY